MSGNLQIVSIRFASSKFLSMENLKESLPLVIIPSKATRKNYDAPTHSITNSGSINNSGATSSEILDEDDELDNPSDCQCYSPYKSWQSSSSPKYQDSEESSDNGKPKSPSFNQTLRLPLFCISPLAAKTKSSKLDESNGKKIFQSMTEQLNNAAMSKITSAPSSPKSNSKEDELQMKLEMAEKRILTMTQQLTQTISSNASPLPGGSPMPYDTTRAGTDKADVYNPLKLGEKVMKIVLCDNVESNKKQVNTLDNCKLASQLQRKLQTDQLRNFSLSHSRDASPKPSNDASPRPSDRSMEAGEIVDTGSRSNSSSKAQNEVLKTEINSMASLDPVLMSAKMEGIEKAPTDISLEDELQRKIDTANEKVSSLSSLSLNSNRTSSKTPTPLANSMAPAEGEDKMNKLSGDHKISEAGDGSVNSSDPVFVNGKDALARASARNNLKESYSNGSSKLQQKLEATKSQIQLLSKELSQVSSENNKFHADLDTLKTSVATISATLMDRSKVRIAQLSAIEKRPEVPQKNT